jgi:type I restriction enzyme S subunit
LIEQRPFEQAAIPQSDRGKRLKQRDYAEAGRIPVIDQGQAFIGGYTDEEDMAFVGETPVILFGDHTRAVKYVDRKFAVGADGIKIFRPANDISPKYLFYWMQSAKIPDRGYGRHYQYLRQLTVPVPDATEQVAIVAEIEKQFSRLDEAVDNLKRVKANLKRYKAAVLKAAVEGRLVPTEAELARKEGRDYETGEQLLTRIKSARTAVAGKKLNDVTLIESKYADEVSLPAGWTSAPSNLLFKFITSGSRGWAKHYSDTGSLFIRVGNLDHNTISLDLTEVQSVAAPPGLEAARARVAPGDLLISITAELGMVALVPENLGDAYVNQHVAIARPAPFVLPKYLAWFFAAADGGKHQLEAMRKGATKAGLGLDDIRSVNVAIPPFAEQHRIIEEVERRFSLIRGVETQTDANLKRAERMRQSVLASMFGGGQG